MSAAVPAQPKIYHIVHIDRLPSIITDGYLWSDEEIERRRSPGSTIGMSTIKQRRMRTPLASHPGLCVGQCVPFYFCTRSVMLYVIHMANHVDLAYRGGQQPIIHLEADLHDVIQGADANNARWAFSLSNAGSSYFEDRNDRSQLQDLNWDAIQTSQWSAPGVKEAKQAEFLIENAFPWELISRIGVISQQYYNQVRQILVGANHKPHSEIQQQWYY